MPTSVLPYDIFNTSADGLDYTVPDETLIIDPGVIVLSQTGIGVDGNGQANPTLINNGFIYETSGRDAVRLDNGNADIVNRSGGEIYGVIAIIDSAGIGSTHVVKNFGNILNHGNGIVFEGDTHGAWFLNNQGYMHTSDAGVEIDSLFARGALDNSGMLIGDHEAVHVSTAPGLVTRVTNEGGGVLRGTDAILVESGRLHFVNHGKVIGDVVITDNEAARIVNDGTIKGTVHLGGGNSSYNGGGGAGALAIYAEGGNDRIIAGKGQVSIHLGGGSDNVTGGPDADRFIFDATPNGHVDKLGNFHKTGAHWQGGGSGDKIVLKESAFQTGGSGHHLPADEFHIGTHPTSPSQHILYDPANGFLFFVPESVSGLPEAPIHFATVSPHLGLTNDDFLVEA